MSIVESKGPGDWRKQEKMEPPTLGLEEYLVGSNENKLRESLPSPHSSGVNDPRNATSSRAQTVSAEPNVARRDLEASVNDVPAASFYTEHGVEEAVFRYVGGTLDGRRKLTYDTDPFAQASWTKYLSDDIADNHVAAPDDNYGNLFVPRIGAQSLVSSSSSQPGSAAKSMPVSEPVRGESRTIQGSHHSNVDPALTHMDNSTAQRHRMNRDTMLRTPKDSVSMSTQSLMVAPHMQAEQRDMKKDVSQLRSGWTGDGSETAGSFTQEETQILDSFMTRYCQLNNLDRRGLCERVWTRERRKDNFWDAVSAVLPQRTRASVYKHVRRTYHVFDARGHWTAIEDQQLADLYAKKGAQWKVIGLLMHRMPEDCRDRYRNYVKCGGRRNQNKWSAKEEEALREIVTTMQRQNPNVPVNWTHVSDNMGGLRSRIQCRYKWNKMMRAKEQSENKDN